MLKTDKTLVFGASLKPQRYSNMAMKSLSDRGFEAMGFGLVEGTAYNLKITSNLDDVQGVHTITIYMRPSLLKPFTERLIGLQPRRVIFNPGAESPETYPKWEAAGVEVVEACTLVMLATGTY